MHYSKSFGGHVHRGPCRSRSLDHYSDHFDFSHCGCYQDDIFLFHTCLGQTRSRTKSMKSKLALLRRPSTLLIKVA